MAFGIFGKEQGGRGTQVWAPRRAPEKPARPLQAWSGTGAPAREKLSREAAQPLSGFKRLFARTCERLATMGSRSNPAAFPVSAQGSGIFFGAFAKSRETVIRKGSVAVSVPSGGNRAGQFNVPKQALDDLRRNKISIGSGVRASTHDIVRSADKDAAFGKMVAHLRRVLGNDDLVTETLRYCNQASLSGLPELQRSEHGPFKNKGDGAPLEMLLSVSDARTHWTVSKHSDGRALIACRYLASGTALTARGQALPLDPTRSRLEARFSMLVDASGNAEVVSPLSLPQARFAAART
jgi:hypothetical protein